MHIKNQFFPIPPIFVFKLLDIKQNENHVSIFQPFPYIQIYKSVLFVLYTYIAFVVWRIIWNWKLYHENTAMNRHLYKTINI